MEGEKGKGYCVYLLLILAWLMLLVGVFWYIASREEERKLKSEIIQGSVDITPVSYTHLVPGGKAGRVHPRGRGVCSQL